MCFITITKITFGFSNQINYFQLQWNMLIMWKCSLSSRKPTLMKHTETSTLHSILSTFQCGKVSPSMKHKNSLNTGDCLSWERAYQMFLPAGCRFHRIFLRGSLTVFRSFPRLVQPAEPKPAVHEQPHSSTIIFWMSFLIIFCSSL